MAKILIIEDEAPIRDNIERFLRLEDFDVLAAVDGQEGVSKARELLPDLILCDVLMPRLNGFAVVEALKAFPETAQIPFVFLSASADPADLEAGLAQGASAYLTKPFILSELLQTIRKLLPPE